MSRLPSKALANWMIGGTRVALICKTVLLQSPNYATAVTSAGNHINPAEVGGHDDGSHLAPSTSRKATRLSSQNREKRHDR